MFDNFFIIQEGVISYSLKDITLFGCVLVSSSILYMLYQSCNDGTATCEFGVKLPMISGLLKLPLYDRVTCMIFTFYSFCVLQANLRSYYKRLYGISPTSSLDSMYFFGVLATFSLPLIGYFDETQFKVIHGVSAGTFFISACVCIFKISEQMGRH